MTAVSPVALRGPRTAPCPVGAAAAGVGRVPEDTVDLVHRRGGRRPCRRGNRRGHRSVGCRLHGGLIEDQGAVFSKVVIYLASAVAVPLGSRWFADRGIVRFEYPILVIIAALCMGMMVSAGDLITLFVSIELQSLALYILAAFQNNVTPGAVVDGKSSEAGLKYFVLGALSSGILLYGASLIYGFAGLDAVSDIAVAMSHGAGGGALFGLVFLICGMGFKVSAARSICGRRTSTKARQRRWSASSPARRNLRPWCCWPGCSARASAARCSSGAGARRHGPDLRRRRRLRRSRPERSQATVAYSSIASIGYALVGLAAGGVPASSRC